MNILLVDDELAYRMLLGDQLSDEGHTVVTAENGLDAMQKLLDQKIDFIISDVYMPVMDGLKFHRKVRETTGFENIPFLFLSAFDDQYTLEAVKNTQVEGFLKKGSNSAELKAWITYLTAPPEKRAMLHPSKVFAKKSLERPRDHPPYSRR